MLGSAQYSLVLADVILRMKLLNSTHCFTSHIDLLEYEVLRIGFFTHRAIGCYVFVSMCLSVTALLFLALCLALFIVVMWLDN